MLSLDQCRKVDPKLVSIPDEKLLMIRDQLYKLSNLILDDLQEKEGSKIPFGHLPKEDDSTYHD